MRARETGLLLPGRTGPFNAITDVPGTEVGQSEIITEQPGYGARTGVTAVFPLGKRAANGVSAGWVAFNGTGEMTGLHYVEETGRFFGPVMLTGTLSIATVYRSVLEWTRDHFPNRDDRYRRHLPIVAETYDGFLNKDEFSFHLQQDNVFAALNGAAPGPVVEGCIGGGTGMMTYEFAGGTGTSSRTFECGGQQYTVGVLVQSNHGRRQEMLVQGVPIGQLLPEDLPTPGHCSDFRDGSIIVVIGTDAPLIPDQLKRLARRATVGMALTGGRGNAGSGDIFLAYSTANQFPVVADDLLTFRSVPNELMTPVLASTIEATEEAILNAVFAGRTMSDPSGGIIHGLPIDRVVRALAAAGRIAT